MIKKRFNDEEFIKKFEEYIIPMVVSDRVVLQQKAIQHGVTSCYLHSIAVAYYSLKLVSLLNIKCDYKSLVKGAMLHDYFLYDWHEKSKEHRFHGFSHPYVAFKNAEKEYEINKIERNIILRHMFPLTPIPPIYLESIIVCLVDKVCSINEVFNFGKYSVCRQIEGSLMKVCK